MSTVDHPDGLPAGPPTGVPQVTADVLPMHRFTRIAILWGCWPRPGCWRRLRPPIPRRPQMGRTPRRRRTGWCGWPIR